MHNSIVAIIKIYQFDTIVTILLFYIFLNIKFLVIPKQNCSNFVL